LPLTPPSSSATEAASSSNPTPNQASAPTSKLADQPTLLKAESLGSGRYALAWSNGAAAIVEIGEAVVTSNDQHEDQQKRSQDGQQEAPQASNSQSHAVRVQASLSADFINALSDGNHAKSDANQTKSDTNHANESSASVVLLPQEQTPLPTLVRHTDSGALTIAKLLPGDRIAVLQQTVTENPLGDQETSEHRFVLNEDGINDIRVMTMDHEGRVLYIGTGDGCIARWQWNENGEVTRREVVRAFPDKRAITAIALMLGEVSLAVGDEHGELTAWSSVNADGVRKLRCIHQLPSHSGAVRAILPSSRNKSLLSLGDEGEVHFDHMTSERRLLSLTSENAENATTKPTSPIHHVGFGSRGDAMAALDDSGKLTAWRISGGCPEVSFKTLFGKVLYEGYSQPEYVWQTTGGDDFEPKFSLVPLIFGTFKGTFYAMLFAAPLALFGAAYASYFAAPGFRKVIKPVVEIMATVPSVVIGFLIALWLAPLIEHSIMVFILCLFTIPFAFVVFMVFWQIIRRYDWARRAENGYEFLLLFPVLLIGIGVAIGIAGPLEEHFFNGNFRQWLFDGSLGIRYNQRNSIIIAFGLGFTVIPIIFSIAEDSLSNVPYNMTAASMALGASRWQTLWRVILPSASPGIFAAMMIGFGRAVGETMIVLMATGNTPILDWSPLNGMRTLSANIAVEIPEAPVGGTLYRVLFLCAVLLFLLTFTVNTVAELVRQHLRKRYGRF
jgi:phosphate transport system permease protein